MISCHGNIHRIKISIHCMAILNKKKSEFTEIYSDYYQVVYGVIYSKIMNSTDADELTQEVFMRFYSKMDTIENVRAWLFGTIHYVLLNFYREKKKLNSEDIEQHLNDVSVTFLNGFRDTRLIIDDAIARLEERERLLFDLIAVQNCTFEIASEHLGLTRRQTQYRYSLIIRDIRAFLSAKGITKIEDLL